MTFIEAAFAGTKSMGFDKTAVPYVLDKVFGYTIKGENVVEMAKKIHELREHREKCKLSLNELKNVKSFFSAEHMAKSYYNIYTEMVKK